MYHLTSRGYIVDIGLKYAIMTILSSYFLIYIPHAAESHETKEKEQRIKIKRQSNFGAFIRFLQNGWVKWIFTILYSIGIIMQIIPMYSIMEVFAEAQGSEPEELITFAIWYLGISIVYLGKYIYI